MLEPNVIDRIRHIFLHPRPHVSISQATALLGWTRRQVSDAIATGEVELRTTPLGKWFPREELMAKALEIWTLDLIDDALGPDAPRVLPDAIRTAELRVRLRATTSPCSIPPPDPASGERSRKGSRHPEVGHLSHLPPLL